MKTGLFLAGFLLAMLLMLSSFSIRENPQEPPRGKKRHINLVKVENGKETKLDTVVEAGKTFVWNGDTIGHDMEWESKDDFMITIDSFKNHFTLKYDVKTDEDSGENVVIFKSKDGDETKIEEFLITSDKKNNTIFISDDGAVHEFKSAGNAVWVTEDGNHAKIHSPHTVKAIATTGNEKIIKESTDNVIDLNDPAIISFKKKKLSDGREKIEIIRKERK